MAKAADSKGKTLAAAAKLFRQQGYHGTALQDILAAGGSPRGSLYFHFPKGKEEIGETALTLAGEAVRQGIAQAAEASESCRDLPAADRRAAWPPIWRSPGTAKVVRSRPPRWKPRRNPRCWARSTRNAFQKWELEIKRGLFRFGISAGDADLTATMVLSQLEGALLLARTYRSLEPLRRAEQAVKLLARINGSGQN